MSVFFINSAQEEAANSPPNDGQSNEYSDADGSNDSQYGDLTISAFWSKIYEDIRRITDLDVRNQVLPLARIKKIMKLDEDVKMISAEVPVLFAKAVEIFIMELTLRAWVHTEENKRRTLQRSDIAMAISKFDQFDFLIDIVPRSEAKMSRTSPERMKSPVAEDKNQVQLYLQVGNQLANIRQVTSPVIQPDQMQTVQLATQGNQIYKLENVNLTDSEGNIIAGTSTAPSQTIQMQVTPSQSGDTSSSSSTDGIHLAVQQVMTPTGEIQHIPIRIVTSGNRQM